MSHDHSATPLYSQVEVTAASNSADTSPIAENTQLMRDILTGIDRQNELMEQLLTAMTASQRQRNAELAAWRKANPRLSRDCRNAVELLGRAQSSHLRRLLDEVEEHGESVVDGEFMLNEMIDRFGPRMAHLNSLLQVMGQLGGNGPRNETASAE
jgi:hypothetical protein